MPAMRPWISAWKDGAADERARTPAARWLCRIRPALAFLAWLHAIAPAFAAAEELPHGDAPPALESPYFPDRTHAFVWRNWNLVAPEKLARMLGTSTPRILELADSMGLPPATRIPPEIRQRGYATLIRRNWHLLPYEQLLELLEMSADQLAFTLREEDFLWVKLGRLKPRCDRLQYQAPGEAERRRAAEIRRVVEQDFGETLRHPAEPRFDFVRQLATPNAPTLPTPTAPTQAPATGLRFTYSYVAVYGDPLLGPTLNPYPDGLLQRLSRAGINGVWLHAVLRDLAPGAPAFPEFGVDHETRLANLRELVRRAAKFGIRVFLYLNEPRAMPASFHARHPEVRGVTEGELSALCTSHPAVREWMQQALTHVFRQVPDLGGIYAITASENLTSCASHGDWRPCRRCADRTDTEIIAEVVATLESGVHRGNPRAEVIVSDWGWKGHGDAVDIIRRLPPSVWLMSVSEWSLPIERGGIRSQVGEYSISAVGPGPRSQRHWDAARAAGLKIAAEVQFNNTCEIASLPYLPVLDLVAQHCRNLAPARLDGMLVGWTMGGYPSPNFDLARRIAEAPSPDIDSHLDALARDRFGPEAAPHARRAWSLMSQAFREYPFHIGVVYTSPVQCGPANPLHPTKTGFRATMWGIPYDDLDGWRGPYPRDVFAAQFEKMADGWQPGLVALQAALDRVPPSRRGDIQADLRLARAAGIHFRSVANQARFVLARDALADTAHPLSPEARDRWRRELRERLESEIALARDLFLLAREDSRIGFEPSCQYFYLPLDLVEKVINCRWLLARREL